MHELATYFMKRLYADGTRCLFSGAVKLITPNLINHQQRNNEVERLKTIEFIYPLVTYGNLSWMGRE